MRRRAIGLAAAIMVGLTVLPGGYAVAARHLKGRHFTRTYVGTQISSNGNTSEAVYKVSDSLEGHGAAVVESTTTTTTFPIAGTAIHTTYFANGVSITKTSFTVSAPDANGISRVSGTGTCTGGTGVYRKQACKYTVTGSANQKTGIATITHTGTITR